MKNNNYKKLSIISLLLILLIYILYTDNNLHENILKNNIINNDFFKIKENFNDYVNVCKNGEIPQFYNLNQYKLGNSITINNDTSGCSSFCNSNKDCVMYTLNENNCNLYKTNGENIINVQCANSKDTIIDENDSIDDINYIYNGVGYVKNKHYNENNDKFKHIDYLLKKSNNITSNLNTIKSHIDNISYDNVENNRNIIYNLYSNIDKDLSNVSNYYNDNSYINNMFSFLLPKSELYGIPDLSINFRDEKYNFSRLYNSFDKLFKSNNNNDAKIESNNMEYNRRYLVYITLSFILLITLLILLLYIFLPKLISNLFMFFYFIGIILLTFFVHLILKQ